MDDKEYTSFYERQERVNGYSGGLDAKQHKFVNVLERVKASLAVVNPDVLEIGAGNGRFQDLFQNYTGIDITESSRKFFHKPYIVINDGEPYPFDSGKFDLVFSNAVFEHIPHVDFALHEMIRVTKRNGRIIFNPAWQCRPWFADGYPVRPFSDFDIWGKLYKLTVPIREHILFRLMHVMPVRFWHLLRFRVNPRVYKDKLVFTQIRANYKHFWMSDSDACNSIDPFMAILFFKANKLRIVNYPSLWKQFFVRTNELILEKKDVNA